jgi:preprotein translocase subunit SecB
MATKKNNSNNNANQSESGGNSKNLKFLINAQYLKDLSFENPKAPNSLRQLSNENSPKFQIDANVASRPLSDHGPNIFEVELSIKSETKTADSTLFIVEAVYCGIFTIENAKDDILDKILLIECPKFLFPFLRSIIAGCTREAGFPPLMIAPLDFVGMYEKKVSATKQ